MKKHVHTRVSLRKPLRSGLTIVICSCLFAGAAQCRANAAQDVAEAARQERARKDQQKKSKHVYTDEDLRRAKILTPEDEATVDARRNAQPAPAEEPAQVLTNSGEIAQLPLGDIARRYRTAKEAAQTPDPFHLPFDEPVFAEPIFSAPSVAAPRPDFAPRRPNFVPARPHAAVAPAMPSPVPSQELAPSIELPKVARPTPVFSPAHPNIVRSTPKDAVAPNLSGSAPVQRLAPSEPFAVPARPATTFSPAHPNALAAHPYAAIGPVIANPGPVRRVDPFTRRIIQLAPPAPSQIAPTLSQRAKVPGLTAAAPEPSATINSSGPEASPSVSLLPVVPATSPAVAATVSPAVAPTTVATSSPAVHSVILQRGQSLWKLAQQNLGRGSRWQELLAANPNLLDPTRIAVGTEIVLPATVTGLKSDLKVTVADGDSLSKIAKATYGQVSAWRCVAEANPQIKDANKIFAGQQLLLPFACSR